METFFKFCHCESVPLRLRTDMYSLYTSSAYKLPQNYWFHITSTALYKLDTSLRQTWDGLHSICLRERVDCTYTQFLGYSCTSIASATLYRPDTFLRQTARMVSMASVLERELTVPLPSSTPWGWWLLS